MHAKFRGLYWLWFQGTEGEISIGKQNGIGGYGYHFICVLPRMDVKVINYLI